MHRHQNVGWFLQRDPLFNLYILQYEECSFATAFSSEKPSLREDMDTLY